MLDIAAAMQSNLVYDVGGRVFYDIEIAVVAVSGYFESVFSVPFGVLDTDIFGGNHFAVEHHLF